ncbi:MAG: hypothetical protein RR426_02305 [Oscillospiraceae bacterium]
MNKLFSTLLSSLKAKIQPLVTKLRFLTTPAFWTTTLFTKLRQFFTKLLDIKPKHKNDYYTVGRWMVSKRLAFALLAGAGVICALYITANLPKNLPGGEKSPFPTYRYNALPLKFKDETVNILARDGHLAYTGPVKAGEVVGRGVLFTARGGTLYEGDFAGNRFNGAGRLYYGGGGLRYDGGFVDNLFQGKGSYYSTTGTLAYEGDYLQGLRSGQGELYNDVGTKIFAGTFLHDKIVYSELVGKATAELAAQYTGRSAVYSTDTEYCVSMEELDAVYSARDGAATLTGEWQADALFVLLDTATIDGTDYSSIAALTKALGQPDYFGTAWVTLPEAICINRLGESKGLTPVRVTATSQLEGVYTVSDYDKNAQIYLYTYLRDGLVYTFYCTGAGRDQFLMYAIKPA